MNRYILFSILILSIFSSIAIADDPPTTFDLRNYNAKNYVTAIKDQSGGTCWTHGAMAAIEGNLLITGTWTAADEDGEPNLAEYHLDWWNGFNKHNNDDTSPTTGGGLDVHYGGDYRITTAYLSRGEGAVREFEEDIFYTPPLRSSKDYHYFYVRDIEWYSPETGSNYQKIIKNKIMTHGVLGTCMYYNNAFMSFDLGYTHYQPVSSEDDPNHAIAIIGWDDNKKTQYAKPGAWLCKNSWGDGWGLQGCFWISYADKHCTAHPEMGAISFQHVEPMAYDHVYYHDYHGWRGTLTDISEVFNSFSVLNNEWLKSVSFFTAIDQVEYLIKIYDRFENGNLEDELASRTGIIEYTGFHTIDLDAPLPISADDDFYIYANFSKGGHPIDRTSEVPVLLGSTYQNTVVKSSAERGESFYRSDTKWLDLYDYVFDDTTWNHTANFCIKGLTVNASATDTQFNDDEVPSDYSLAQNYPNPFNSNTTISYTLPSAAKVTIKVYNLVGEEIKTLFSQHEHAGYNSVVWDGTNRSGQFVSSGVYFYRLEADGRILIRKMTFLK